MRRRVHAAAPPSASFLHRRGRPGSHQFSASSWWAEGALRCHARDNDGGASIQVLSVSSVFWVCPLVFLLSWRSWAGWKIGLATATFFVEAPPPGVRCAMVCRCGWCPGRHSVGFTIYRLSRGHRQTMNSRWIASGTLAQCEHAMPTSPNSSKSIPFSTKISDFFRRLDCGSNSPRPTMKMPSW